MDNRIEINGVWYVRETDETPNEVEAFELIRANEILIEVNDFLMAGSVLVDDEVKYSMVAIEVKFKNSTRDTEYWDNGEFIVGLAKGGEKQLRLINDESDAIKTAAIQIAKEMLRLGWVK